MFNKITVGYFGPTTLTGYNLTQHSGGFIERAPEKYARIRDVYLKFREQKVAETGSHSMTIWDAYPEMQRVTGLSFGQLSGELTRMSVEMFLHHPVLYFKSVLRSERDFWLVANYWRPERIHRPAVAHMLQAVWSVEKTLLRGVNALFLVVSLSFLVESFTSRRNKGRQRIEDWVAVAVVLCGSVVQALLEYGENPRYAVPFQPLIVYVVVISAWRLLSRLTTGSLAR